MELRGYLIKRGASLEVAEDIVQDTFMKVLEMELVLPPEKLRPYLYRIVWSTYIDWCRRENRWEQLVNEALGPNLETTSFPTSPFLIELTGSLRRLRPHEQQLLVYRYHQRWSMRRIARVLGTSPAAVKMRLQRLQRKLRKYLEED
ncbi:hypothetical protein FD25_GL000102 [Levilactobacillus acidifarinae DSM 19394]|uniref:RNA polymerase sigma factor n=1 Tax=Levilactobacillus acidifarinae DSM 19394 = JCM 15949 TaxID=1423715 RepID=A0A0R1LVN9_9LACO|nr:hypothetical protein FD25_GL000102 [Levilactobacillus acidifarinae DSM 19394]